jgi:hypothetical protein
MVTLRSLDTLCLQLGLTFGKLAGMTLDELTVTVRQSPSRIAQILMRALVWRVHRWSFKMAERALASCEKSVCSASAPAQAARLKLPPGPISMTCAKPDPHQKAARVGLRASASNRGSTRRRSSARAPTIGDESDARPKPDPARIGAPF